MIRPTVEEFIKTAVPSVPRVDRPIGWECAQEEYRARAYQVDRVDLPGGPDVEDTPGVAPGLKMLANPVVRLHAALLSRVVSVKCLPGL